MSTVSPNEGVPSAHAGTEPPLACDIFYLRTERHMGGFRWVVAQFGVPAPVFVSPTVFPTDHAAKVSGRVGLDRFLIRQNSLNPARTPS